MKPIKKCRECNVVLIKGSKKTTPKGNCYPSNMQKYKKICNSCLSSYYKNKSCKKFEFPKFKNLEGQFSPPKKAFVNAVNFTMSGDTEKAKIEKLALRKNAAVLRKKLQSKKLCLFFYCMEQFFLMR